MRILHIVSNISIRNGIMSVIMSYCRNIDSKNFAFDFLYFDDTEKENTYFNGIKKMGGNVYKINKKNALKLFKEINCFIKENALKYQIIHLHENYLIGSLINIKKYNKNIKIISHAHATKFSDKKIKAIRNKFFSIPNLFIPDKYLACSNDAGVAIFGKKFQEKGKILHNAIDLSKFCSNKKIRNKLRKELKIDDKFVIGHVGNFNKQKNHSFLIDCFYEIQKIKDNSVLVLVGDGVKREEILNKCRNLNIINKVIYLGVRTDVNDIMNCFDCFVLPSTSEGLGIVLIEAQTMGIPCVFADTLPDEANIVRKHNCKMSLKLPASVWAKKILNCQSMRESNTKGLISKAGYDIKIETKKLEKYYLNLCKYGGNL